MTFVTAGSVLLLLTLPAAIVLPKDGKLFVSHNNNYCDLFNTVKKRVQFVIGRGLYK